MLKGNLDVQKIHRAGFKLYLVEEPPAAPALDPCVLLSLID
jgi:hypothetical protein